MYRETKELTETEVQHPCLPKWRKRIDEAEKRGRFWDREKRAAADWDSCAVGEARALGVQYYANTGFWGRVNEFRGREGQPKDIKLKKLGMEFSWQVDDDDFLACRDTLEAIEKRLAELA